MRSLLRWLGLGAGQPEVSPPPPDPGAEGALVKSLADLEAASSLFDQVTGAVAVDKAIFRLNLAQAEVDQTLHPQAKRRLLTLPWLVDSQAPDIPPLSPPEDPEGR